VSLFKPPRHKWIADIVSFTTPKEAREAARKLIRILERGRHGRLRIGRERALEIVRALYYASNRARASARRHNLSRKEKHELHEIARIYRRAAEKADRIYHKRYAEEE
jgi:hypothetical protein